MNLEINELIAEQAQVVRKMGLNPDNLSDWDKAIEIVKRTKSAHNLGVTSEN